MQDIIHSTPHVQNTTKKHTEDYSELISTCQNFFRCAVVQQIGLFSRKHFENNFFFTNVKKGNLVCQKTLTVLQCTDNL